ncbi:MAG: type II toxin-antitoxin system VapC family toxin, partial [Geminicoccaceae bacterium]
MRWTLRGFIGGIRGEGGAGVLRVLLDTHALLWWLEDAPALSANARKVIGDPVTVVLVSTGSIWEVVIKARLGRLDVPDDLETFFTRQL